MSTGTMTTMRALTILILACVPAAGCGEHREHGHENPNAEACEHLKEGPAVAVSAAAAASTDAAKIGNDHKRYDVTLVDVTGGKGGFVSFAAAKEGEYILFTSAPAKLNVKSAAMADVAAESSAASVTECTDVKGRHVYDLKVGTYVIGIGPETADKVSFVVEASDAH